MGEQFLKINQIRLKYVTKRHWESLTTNMKSNSKWRIQYETKFVKFKRFRKT